MVERYIIMRTKRYHEQFEWRIFGTIPPDDVPHTRRGRGGRNSLMPSGVDQPTYTIHKQTGVECMHA